MPVIPQTTIEQVRNASDIVDVIGSYLKLKRAGTNFVGLCPFHKEKTPSFNVSPTKQIFHCFGCHKGGDVISFLCEFENLTFSESVQSLAKRARIPIEPEDLTNDQREEDQREENQREENQREEDSLSEKYKSSLLHEQLSKPPPPFFQR